MNRTALIVAALTATTMVADATLGTGSLPDGVEVTRALGGSIKTVLSQNIVLNEKSSLQREWIAVEHTALPVKLKATPGVKTVYESARRSGEYMYVAEFEIEATEPVSAVEIRFLTFDVWGERGKSLVQSEIEDFDAGVHKLEGEWNLYSENDASAFYASIAYVARVRTKDGKVLVADSRPVIEEAKKFYAKFAETDLEPEKSGSPAKRVDAAIEFPPTHAGGVRGQFDPGPPKGQQQRGECSAAQRPEEFSRFTNAPSLHRPSSNLHKLSIDKSDERGGYLVLH